MSAVISCTSRDGTRIALETSGSGPALVVVDGALTDRASAAPLRPHLDRQFTVVAYDRRGRGDSGDAAEYAPEREIEDLAAVIERAGAPAFVYGHSSGAVLALRAVMAGLPVRQLAVHEPPFILPGARPLPAADIPARLAALVEAGDRAGALRTFLLDAVGLPAAALSAIEGSPAWPRLLSLAHTTPYDAAISGTSEFPPADTLATVRVRTLVLFGTASFPWIIAAARALATKLPNATLAGLDGQTHAPAAEAVASELVRYFVG